MPSRILQSIATSLALAPLVFPGASAQGFEASVTPAEATQTASLDQPVLSRAAALPGLMASSPNIIADLASAVSPAVVNIRVLAENGQTVSEGHGSGFVISPSGEVVTNNHVIDEGNRIEIEFNNGVTFDATIIGTDPETDIALLQIESEQTFPVVEWRAEAAPLRVGEFVVPIGNPFGIGQSVSFGIVSAIGRDRVDSGAYVDYIQTDATVNTGNSGGPLFDLRGKVVAVNSAIYSPTGASVGIAFAIPSNTAMDVIERLRRDGEVRRGYLGVGLRTAEFSDGRAGATVDSVVPGGPAQLAGLQVEDIILSINGTRVANGAEATRIIGDIPPGGSADFRIDRSEREISLSARLVKRPSKDVIEGRAAGLPSTSNAAPTAPMPPGRDLGKPGEYASATGATGISVVDLSSQFRSAVGMSYDEVGVYVEAVLAGTGGEAAGFKLGMIIMEFDTQPVASAAKFNEYVHLARQAGQSSALVKVRLKDGQTTYKSLPLR